MEFFLERGDGLGLDFAGFARRRWIASFAFDAIGLTEFFEVNRVLGHPGEGVNEMGIFLGIFLDHVLEELNVDAIEDLLELGAGQVDDGARKRHGAIVGGEAASPETEVANEIGAFFGAKPILEAAFKPSADVIVVNVVAFGGEEFDDGAVGAGVVEHEVDLLAQFGGKAGDLAGATMGRNTHDQ